jgi:serine/threonine-protein kinase
MTSFTRNLIIVGSVIAVAAFLVGYGVTTLTFMRARAPIDVVTVPDVRELKVADATRALARAELTLVVGDSFPNPTQDAGSIVAQSPLPGQEVAPGAEVRVIISTGTGRVAVPDVAEMAVGLATRTLRVAGFDVDVEDVPSEAPSGRVIASVPAAGATIALPATVRLQVSSDQVFLQMPSLIGMFERNAVDVAAQAGLNVTEVLYERSDEGVEAGAVFAQEPPPGETVMPGSDVKLRVRSVAPTGLRNGAGPLDASLSIVAPPGVGEVGI